MRKPRAVREAAGAARGFPSFYEKRRQPSVSLFYIRNAGREKKKIVFAKVLDMVYYRQQKKMEGSDEAVFQ